MLEVHSGVQPHRWVAMTSDVSLTEERRTSSAKMSAPDLSTLLRVSRPSADVALVTINRPERRNALTLAMWSRLAELFEALGEARELRSIVLAGANCSFCAGADITEFGEVRSTPEDARVYAEAVERALLSISRCPKATFAAISGPAFGGGCALAVACDFRIADTGASFAIPAARRGLVCGVEETRLVYLAVGLVGAKELLFTGRVYGAADALAIGLATELAEGDALNTALERAGALASSAPLSIAGTKLVLEALIAGETPERATCIEAACDKAMASEDYREATQAFTEKRQPQFKGC